jgi:hypothetical protein
MNPGEKPVPFSLSAPEYILDIFAPTDHIAMLVLNRNFGALQRSSLRARKISFAFSKTSP